MPDWTPLVSIKGGQDMDSELFENETLSIPELDLTEPPTGSDRRAFMVRSAMATAIAALGGTPNALWAQATAGPPLQGKENPDLQVVKNSKGPVMTLVDEFYKVGPGPSSSHTIGPMRITYDFYQRAIKLPQAQLDQATALKVHLYGSLSATGKGHGTERASLAGLVGKEPATMDLATGATLWLPAQSHQATNVGKTHIKIVVVEIK